MNPLRETLVNAVEALEALERYCNMQPAARYHDSARASIADLRAQIEALDKAKPVAYYDKDQPFGIAWCPGFPGKLKDITPLYTTPQSCPQCAKKEST